MVLVSVLVSLNPAAGIDGEVEGGRALPREGGLLLAAPRVEGEPQVLPLPPERGLRALLLPSAGGLRAPPLPPGGGAAAGAAAALGWRAAGVVAAVAGRITATYYNSPMY